MNDMEEQNLDRVGAETNIDDTDSIDSVSSVNDTDNLGDTDDTSSVDSGASDTNEADSTAEPELHKVEQKFDIFAWANNLSRIKNDLDVDLFLVNKHYTVYHLNVASSRRAPD